MEPLLRAEGLRHRYGETWVLDVQRLELGRGELLAVVGPNGAGKSTLLRLLGLLEPPSQGRIELLGRHVNGSGPAPLALRRRVAMVFQQPALFRGSVRANVGYGLRVRGLRAAPGELDELLARLALDQLAERPTSKLSGGERQRVAVARALALELDLLLLDEPTAQLDPRNVARVETALGEHRRRHRTSVVLVTHNLFQARRLADRVALLLDGRLVEVAETGRFFEAPEDPRVRAFVSGEMVY